MIMIAGEMDGRGYYNHDAVFKQTSQYAPASVPDSRRWYMAGGGSAATMTLAQ